MPCHRDTLLCAERFLTSDRNLGRYFTTLAKFLINFVDKREGEKGREGKEEKGEKEILLRSTVRSLSFECILLPSMCD